MPVHCAPKQEISAQLMEPHRSERWILEGVHIISFAATDAATEMLVFSIMHPAGGHVALTSVTSEKGINFPQEPISFVNFGLLESSFLE